MNHDLETLIVEAATNFDLPEPESTLLLEFASTGGDPGGGRSNGVMAFSDKVYLEGVFLSATSNSDIKFSSVEDMHRAVRDYQKQFVETGQGLGELRSANWQPKPTPDPEKAALRVVDLSIEGDDVRGKAVLISPKLRALVLAGWRPVIRVRALGRQDQNGSIKAGFKIMAFDVSWSESPGRATLNAFGRAPATSKSATRLTEQQHEPTPAAPATPSKRLISPELLAEKFDQKKLNENRMREWISSVHNQTDF
ncbi:hypothetical protein [Shewanella algae]|uniref:hypothetical protein n=1 Tax=Shewanella algae TaxID=38313 RepID=UPI001AAD9638|nr:hypothetical protein [Shewanella algae]MBO2682808.1 hypothetical protein [Shewanella algae]